MNEKFKYNSFASGIDGLQDNLADIWGEDLTGPVTEDSSRPMTKSDFDRIADESDKLMSEVVGHMDDGPRSRSIQKLINKHYENLRNFYEPTLALYRGLATLYVEDSRFSAYFSKFHPDLPRFMHDAMIAFCDLREAKTC